MDLPLKKKEYIKLFLYKKNSKNYPKKMKKLLITITLFLVLMFFCKFNFEKDISIINLREKKRLKLGVVGVAHTVNVGNNMLKYAISVVLSNLGFEPYIIGTHSNNVSIEFLNKTTNIVIIRKNFSEIKENDYNILMVNSDQTWRKFGRNYNYLDYGFLRFAQNWKIKKFIYGASLGFDYWNFSPKEDMLMKKLLNNSRAFRNYSRICT